MSIRATSAEVTETHTVEEAVCDVIRGLRVQPGEWFSIQPSWPHIIGSAGRSAASNLKIRAGLDRAREAG